MGTGRFWELAACNAEYVCAIVSLAIAGAPGSIALHSGQVG